MRAAALSLLAVPLLVAGLRGQGGCSWSPVGGPPPAGAISQWVKALTVYDDGTGPALYAGGFFSKLGTVYANYVARWDGTSWSTLGSGTNSIIRALEVFDDGSGSALYAGGDFVSSNGNSTPSVGVARWDGFTWSAVGTGLNGSVRALVVHDDGSGPALYAGGFFTASTGGTGASYVARWDGLAWAPVGAGFNDAVYSLGVYDDGTGPALYAGGVFTATAGGVPCSRMARWDGNAWSAVGAGVNSGVWVLDVYDDGNGPGLYAGGDFTALGTGAPLRYIARWDGSSWSTVGGMASLGGGVNGSVRALSVFDDGGGPDLYAGGYFSSITGGGPSLPYIAQWDGLAWSGLGFGMNGKVRSLGVFDSGAGASLFAGGSFAGTNSGIATYKIGEWGCGGSSISLSVTQPGGPGGGVYFHNTNLTPGREYLNLFSLDLCPGGPGTGFYAGLCIFTQPNLQFMLDQLQTPLGTPLFHFPASGDYTTWGPWLIGPVTLDALCFEYTGGTLGAISPAVRITIQ